MGPSSSQQQARDLTEAALGVRVRRGVLFVWCCWLRRDSCWGLVHFLSCCWEVWAAGAVEKAPHSRLWSLVTSPAQGQVTLQGCSWLLALICWADV